MANWRSVATMDSPQGQLEVTVTLGPARNADRALRLIRDSLGRQYGKARVLAITIPERVS